MITNAIAVTLKGLVNTLFSWIFSILSFIIYYILDTLFQLLPSDLPTYTTLSTYLHNFWDLVFSFIGWFRSAFLIDSFSMYLIILILTIRFTYKPILSIYKMIVNWIKK